MEAQDGLKARVIILLFSRIASFSITFKLNRPSDVSGIFAPKPIQCSHSRRPKDVLHNHGYHFFSRSMDNMQLVAEVFGLKDYEPPGTFHWEKLRWHS
jgi:hypothetical protein